MNRRFAQRFGPWALVTGASEGIGREMARGLARRGLNVILVARREEVLVSLAAELAVRTDVVAADLSTPEGVTKVLAAAEDKEVGLAAFAAGFGTSGDFTGIAAEEELQMVDLNCRSVVALLHGLVPAMAARGRGGVVLFSSLVAFQGVPRASTYAATKAFNQVLAEGLRLELGASGVEVLATAPGPVESGFGTRADMRMSGALSSEVVAEGTIRALGRRGTVRPGFSSRGLEWALRWLPRSGRSRMVGRVMAQMTRHQDILAAPTENRSFSADEIS
ncbi:MAG: SDR family NAD(P)-dependent oxidoreductase [Myxococcota bacterium]